MRISPSFKILQKSPPLLSIIILIIGNQDQMPALDVAIAIVAIGNVVALKNISMSGTDTFTYKVENGKGDISNIAKVTVIVQELKPDDLTTQIYPTAGRSTFYPNIKIMKTFDVRKFMRQYSDKPDEPSVEAVVDSHIPFINQEFSGYIKVKSMLKPEPIEIVVR